MNINYDFSKKNVVVTGGGQGIGFEVARRFLSAGARVAIWDRSAAALQHCQNELKKFGSALTTQAVDIADYSQVLHAAENLPFALNILINNAGITRDKSFRKMEHEDYEAVIQVNLIGTINVTKCLLEKFSQDNGHARIINISSIVGIFGNFGQANYAASKAGVIGFTKTLAKELGPKGFTVNAVAPGYTETEMVKTVPQDQLKAMAARVPVGRVGQTTDQANACLFLAADESQYINGITLSVDGGAVI
jgi:3-oxoacyl-[acyl-carrier protein] reductase